MYFFVILQNVQLAFIRRVVIMHVHLRAANFTATPRFESIKFRSFA